MRKLNIFKKSPVKKEDGPLWKISTKVVENREDALIKSRKNKKSWVFHGVSVLAWFKNYFKTVGWVFFSGILAVILFTLFATPLFQLNPDRIDVVLRPEPVFDRNAVTGILRDFAGKNVFSISTREVFQSLSENIRHIASVEKTLLLPDGMRITLTSFAPSYRAFIGEESFLLTENGQLIADIPEVEAPALEIHHLVSDPNIGKSTPIMIEDMTIMREILQLWRKSLTTYPIESIKFYDQEKELHITSSNTRYIMSLSGGREEIKTLITLITGKHINTNNQEYIDLRVPKRIYTCPSSENACKQNIARIYEG